MREIPLLLPTRNSQSATRNLLFLLTACLLVSVLCTGAEAALLSLSRARLRSRVHAGDLQAARLERMLAHPDCWRGAGRLVAFLANAAALVLVTDAWVRRWDGRGCLTAGLVILPVYLLGLQRLPGSLFPRLPFRAVAALANLLEGTARLLSPLLAASRWLAGRALPQSAPVEPSAGGTFQAREDLPAAAVAVQRAGALSPAEHSMIGNVLAYQMLTARDVMQSLPEPFHLPAPSADGLDPGNAPRVADLLEFARARGLDSVLVLDAAGELAGLADVFALLLERDPQRPVAASLRRPPLVVAPDDPALRVLRRLRSLRLKAAVVRGDSGGAGERLAGVIRTADLVQRLVRAG